MSKCNTGSREELMEALGIGLAAEKADPVFTTPHQSVTPETLTGNLPTTTPSTEIREAHTSPTKVNIPAAVASSVSQSWIYGDGNLCEAGDLVECGDMIAEVKRVAANGIVLEIPAKGMEIINGSQLLQYRKLGSGKR